MHRGVPFFSIIVPTYNVEDYLEACITSLVTQTFVDWECLCVDDGSSDKSGLLLDGAVRNDARFCVIHQPNGGVSAARNRALKHPRLRGVYIGFVDPDDLLLPERFSVAHQIIKEKNVDLVRLKLTHWRAGEPVSYAPTTQGAYYANHDEVLRWGVPTFLKEGWVHPLFIRKEGVLNRITFPLGIKIREDSIFSVSLLETVQHAFEGEDCGYCYRQRENSAVSRPRTSEEVLTFVPGLLQLWHRASYESSQKAFFREYFNRSLSSSIIDWLVDSRGPIPFSERCAVHFVLLNAFRGGLSFPKSNRLLARVSLWLFFYAYLIFPARLMPRISALHTYIVKLFRSLRQVNLLFDSCPQ